MKELSIEEKAKLYDEAIEIAKEINNEQRAQPFNIMTRVFPELKDEDERIRKAIGYAIGQSTHSDGTLINGVSSEEALAWLEKQGDKDEEILILKDQIESLHAAIKAIKETHRIKLEEWLDEYVSDLADVDTASLICSFTNYLDGIKERKETKN